MHVFGMEGVDQTGTFVTMAGSMLSLSYSCSDSKNFGSLSSCRPAPHTATPGQLVDDRATDGAGAEPQIAPSTSVPAVGSNGGGRDS